MLFELFGGSLNPLHIFDILEFRRNFKKAHPEYFDPDGILVFCGAQGSGKTISAVNYLLHCVRKYPDLVVCSNVALQDQEDIVFCVADDLETGRVQRWLGERETGKKGVIFIPYDDVSRLTTVSNGYGGVLYLIDEMHLEFNSLESKQLDSNIFYTVSQQRKQRKHIVGTSQVFTRLAKPFREQFKWAVSCHCIGHCFQVNRLIDALNAREVDGHLEVDKVKTFFWFHSSRLYDAYDTLQIIRRTRDEWQKGR